MIGKTFEQCKDDPMGTIYADWEDGKYRCLVMRGGFSLCGYIGVKEGHPLFGKDYDDIDVRCHCGLTYAAMGGGEHKPRPEGYWWIGWDYAHYCDAPMYDETGFFSWRDFEATEWTPDMVVAEFPEVIADIERLISEA